MEFAFLILRFPAYHFFCNFCSIYKISDNLITYDEVGLQIFFLQSRFIRPSEITAREQASILARLNQVLQTRISICAKRMSPRITSVLIKNGMVCINIHI